jgi:hypothetical protein
MLLNHHQAVECNYPKLEKMGLQVLKAETDADAEQCAMCIRDTGKTDEGRCTSLSPEH